MATVKGLTVADVEDIEYDEIPQTSIDKAFGNYWFVRADYGEGLNYSVAKELINRDLDTIEGEIGGKIDRVEDSLPAKEYLEMMFPLLQKVKDKLGGEVK